jgi:hypothetical protein
MLTIARRLDRWNAPLCFEVAKQRYSIAQVHPADHRVHLARDRGDVMQISAAGFNG